MAYLIEKRALSVSTETFSKLTATPHLHTHLEMIYMVEGSSTVSADYREFSLNRGDLFLAFPNQIHFYHDHTSTSGYLFIFSQDIFPDLKELFHTMIPDCPVIKCGQLPDRIRESLHKIMLCNTSGSHFDEIAAKGLLLALLCELLPLLTLRPHRPGNDSTKSILTYCSEKYTEPLSLDILSRELHLNKYYISHIFKEHLNIGFTDFINGLRVEYACSILERESCITDVAFASGFSSIRTFNRVFLNRVGMTPSEYIKRKEQTTA